jgi:hypothetical protein
MALNGQRERTGRASAVERAVVIKRLLDAGFTTSSFRSSRAQRRRGARWPHTRYPPAGIRGVSVSQRSNRYGSVKDYFRIVNDNIAVMVQIESARASMPAAAIAAVDGVDGLFIGPSDLAAAFGPSWQRRASGSPGGDGKRVCGGESRRQADGYPRARRAMRAAICRWARRSSPSAAISACCGWRHKRSSTSTVRPIAGPIAAQY